MPGLKNSPPQALWEITILIGAYLLVEGFINRFYHSSTNFDGFKGRQL